MSPAVEAVRAEIDRLREDRRRRGHAPVLDRPFLDRLDDMFDGLTSEEFLAVNGEGWRGWPDLYDARIAKSTAS